ncbi:MAG: sn-glycerol-3-phosphate ABC transporter ATP-binding protein UgpC [Polyangia bacterium]|jgi:ABC-type sugar transport system ATPase subunit|nr:sn-glycerol-3-phosphate ABC transporter ATP-binding protein UgpC [Polyangia bacterium]
MDAVAEVRFVDVRKSYDKVVVIDHLDLSISDGEFAVLVGPSGCGKSTTLRMIAGLESITSGDLFIGDRRVNDVPPKDRDIAMVFQSYALYPHMSVFDNLAFGLALRKLPKDEIQRRVREAAETLGITPYLDRKPKQLSGGQRQRVAMGRAIVRQPKVFLFDEPLSNLDAKLRGEMRREIARLHREKNTTVVYVTHDQVEAMTLADRIVVINRGDIMQSGTPLELFERPANRFVAEFIGSPKMNLVEVSAGEGGRVLLGEGFHLEVPSGYETGSAARVLAGARPGDTLLLDPADGAAVCKGEVVMVEPLGAEAYLTVATAVGDVTVRQEGHGSAAVGDRVGIGFPKDKLHLFDAGTGKSLRRGEGA